VRAGTMTPFHARPHRHLKALLGLPRRFAAARSGNVSVELALLAPVLVLILLAVAEYGRAYAEKLVLARMARAQVQYAVENLGASSVLGKIEAMTTTLANGDTVTYDAERSCSCLGDAADCQTLCNGSALPELVVEVSATRKLTPITFFPGHPGPLTLTATASMRAR
jgi:Flp pilus assembly protein TadG